MQQRELGKSGLKVSALGLGCMGMSEFYDPTQMNDEESIRVIHRYLDAGGNFLDTADVYGMGRNETLVGKALKGRRDGVVLATKFANVRDANRRLRLPVDSFVIRKSGCRSVTSRLLFVSQFGGKTRLSPNQFVCRASRRGR
jgi:aryl-alcohol dehydrogenase-like predicted oxidoreductase